MSQERKKGRNPLLMRPYDKTNEIKLEFTKNSVLGVKEAFFSHFIHLEVYPITEHKESIFSFEF
jgi:hypothetical protein